MRKSFLLYLFVFTALLAVFIYVSGKRMLDAKSEEISTLEEELALAKQYNDSLSTLDQPDPFSLSGNEEALSYLENRGFDAGEVMQKVEAELIGRNKAAADNDLVPYAGMEGPFRINSVKLLNHKWVIASFTDGTYWGDLFLTYELGEEGALQVTTQEAVLYPKN